MNIFENPSYAAINILNHRIGQRLLRNRGRLRGMVASQLTVALKKSLIAFMAGRWNPSWRDGTTKNSVSLTSWKPRLPDLPVVLISLLKQSVCPSGIFVWLTREDYVRMDQAIIERFSDYDVRFRICDDIKSHKKWLPLIEDGFTDSFVICDDDTLYPDDWLKQLTEEDRRDAYVGTRCHEIHYNPAGAPARYDQWKHDVGWRESPSHDLFITGVGGAVIHPDRIGKSFRDREKIMRLCSNSDDIWLKAAHVDAGVPCYKTQFSFPCFELPGSLGSSLLRTNVDAGYNDVQIINMNPFFNRGAPEGAIGAVVNRKT